jgi:DNA-binding NarL/FixJ family response regulator
MRNTQRILIADDHNLIISGIETIIENNKLGEIVAKVNDGKELLLKLNSTSVNLIILDINMPNLNGIETAEKVLARYPLMKILIISQYENLELIKKLKLMGVKGYLSKTFEEELFIEAIKNIHKGMDFFPLLEIKKEVNSTNIYNLTNREVEVINLISNELSTKEIAKTLFLSEYTIQTHRKNIIRKTGAKTTIAFLNLSKELGYKF